VAKECSKVPCGRYGYCTNGSCQCEVGFVRKGNRCRGKNAVMNVIIMVLAETKKVRQKIMINI
jgi:hypothetical protein